MRVERVRRCALAFVLLCGFVTACTRPQDPMQAVAKAQAQFDFHSNLWVNLHHVLYEEALRRHPQRDGTLAQSLLGPTRLTPDELATWNSAVTFYDQELISNGRDLLRDEGLRQIKVLLEAQEAQPQLNSAPVPQALRDILQQAATVYSKHWWPLHDASNRQLAQSFTTALGKYGPPLQQELVAAYRSSWPGGTQGRMRVDLVYYANWEGGYSFSSPAEVTIGSSPDERWSGWRKLEQLFLEASQPLLGQVNRDITAAAQQLGRAPDQLSQATLFFTTGEIVRRTLEKDGITDYVPYAYANGLFAADGDWGAYARALEKYWQPYLSGTKDYGSAMTALVDAMPAQ